MADNIDDIGPPKDWLDSNEWTRDELAFQEQKKWPVLGDLKAQQIKNRLVMHQCIGLVLPVGLISIFAIFLSSIFIYAFHLLSPQTWHFLSDVQLSELHNIIFSSIVGAGVTQLARVYFTTEE